MKNKIVNQLQKARSLIEEFGFHKETLGDKTVGFCVIGALVEATHWKSEAHEDIVRQVLPSKNDSLILFNDDPKTKKQDILSLFDAATSLVLSNE